MHPNRVIRGFLFAAAVALAAVAMRALRTDAMDHYLAAQRYEDVYYVPPPSWLQVLSLGYDAALADLLWMRALVYFGQELEHRGDVEHVYDYAESMLALDPEFKRVYDWVGTAAIYRTGEVRTEDLRRAAEFVERGARRFPDDGELAWQAGATLAYELAPHLDDPEEKRRVRRRAVEHLMVAARKGAGPRWLTLSNVAELQRLGETEVALRHLEEMYAAARSSKTKAAIAKRIEQLRGEAHAEALRQAHRDFERRREQDYPWMSPGLYMLVGPRPPVDGARLLKDYFLPPAGSGRERSEGAPR